MKRSILLSAVAVFAGFVVRADSPRVVVDEAGGKSRAELEKILDDVELKYAHRPYFVTKTRYMMAMFDHARLCLSPDEAYAFRTMDGDLIFKRLQRRVLQFRDSSPDRQYLFRWLPETDGSFVSSVDRHHNCPDWESLLKFGLVGLADRAAARVETAENETEKTFLKCVEALYRSFARALSRWAKFAAREGRAELAKDLEALSVRPPQTLREAIQLGLVFDHFHEMEGESVRSQGLFDRLYIGFYRDDLKAGRETRESAKELMRGYYDVLYAILPGYPNKNVAFGGLDEKGEAVWNELTEIGFELHYELARPSPKLVYRVGSATPRAHLEKVARCLADGRTSVVFANDDVLCDSFRRRGKSAEDAANYVLIGCYEPGVAGREVIASMSSHVNLVKPIEAALNGGVTFKGFRLGPSCAFPQTYAEFEAEYLRQLAALIMRTLDGTRFCEERWPDLNPSPLYSGCFRDCIESRRDISMGGAKYNQSGVVCFGLPTVADSLAAVRYLVEEAKLVTLAELADILKRDWAGAEELRLKALRAAPKWGNNDDRVDALAVKVQKAVADQVNATRNGHGGTFQAGFWTIDLDLKYGKYTAATPDGRRAGTALARNNCAMAGCGKEGMTALMLSNAKLDLREAPDGHILDLIVPATLAKSERGPGVIASMLESYFKAGGQCAHVNCFDSATLRDAMAHPEKYPDLQVRVCGWSVRWVDLSREEQEHFLLQTETEEGAR